MISAEERGPFSIKSQLLIFSKRGWERMEGRGGGLTLVKTRWGVSEAALCGKGQGFSKVSLSSRLVGGRWFSEGTTKSRWYLMLPISYMPVGILWGRTKIHPLFGP